MEKVALFDLDDTLADHTTALRADLVKIASPGEPDYARHNDLEADFVKARKRMIRSQPGWWANLPKLQLGWDILNIVKSISDFRIHILTKGPWSTPYAWTEKLQWVQKHLSIDTEITITKDKGLVYGSLLVDDYPDYVKSWLKYRPRGVAIMPGHDWNADFSHPRVVRYTGTNEDEIVKWVYRVSDRVDEFNKQEQALEGTCFNPLGSSS